MPTTHQRTCPLCEATCGLEITMDGDRVVRIRGDRDDVFSHGFICPKGSTLKQLHEDPDRLRAPSIRHGDDPASATWREVSWEEAFTEVERRLVPILETHGRDAVALYLGNPTVHNAGATLYIRPLVKALGSKNLYSASTVDQMPKHVSSGLLFGHPLTIPVPDLDRTDHLLLLGANPWESNGSLCTAPDFPGRLEAIRARGGRFVVVDPRRTRTAAEADEHIRIRPGTDAHLLLAMIHVLFRDGLVRLGALAPHTDGVDAVRDLAVAFAPEAVAQITTIDPATITRLTHDLAGAPTAAVYGRIGTNTVAFGTLASWAVDVLNVLTGNLDRPGGAMFPLAAHGSRGKGRGRGFVIGRHHSRVKGHPEVRSELPVATLADEIETPGEGRVRALITVGGNPVLSAPNSGRLDAALSSLDLMISVDPYRNETTRHADVLLPPPSPLARSHYDLAFSALSIRNIANYSPPLVEANSPHESEILARLTLIAGGQGAAADPTIIDDLLASAMLDRAGATELTLDDLVATDPVDRLVEIMVRTGPYGLTFQDLLDNPHGIDLGPLEPRIPEVLSTVSGRIELAPEPIVSDLARLRASLTGATEDRIVLVGRRDLRSNNSWMHNVEVLVKGKPRCTLHVHPDDAARLGLVDGATAKVASRVGALVVPVELTDTVMPGVVSLPHGWGHDLPGARLGVAERYAGVNANVLTDDDEIDPLSGNAVLNAIPVSISPA